MTENKKESENEVRRRVYLKKAIQDFTEAIRLNPKYDQYYVNRGIVYSNPHVREVIQYLNQNGLRAELKDSALQGDDVDILATGSLEDITEVTCALNGAKDIADPFYSTARDSEDYTVVHEGENVAYMRENLAQLFKILVGDTKIHVGLKTKPSID